MKLRKSVQPKLFTKNELISMYKELMKKANLWCEDEAAEQWIVGSFVDAAIGLVFYETMGYKSLDYFLTTE